MTGLTVGSLFSGIGGMDLGLTRAGWQIRFQVEIDPWCQRVLAQHWPAVTRYGDIREVDWHGVEPVTLVCGGFPCQPVSVAGRRRAAADDRWLWPEFARAIRVLRPRFVLVENVPGLLHRGFGDVLGDLAASGYDAEWDCLPAAALGAPHRRDRLWLVAYAHGERPEECSISAEERPSVRHVAGRRPEVAYPQREPVRVRAAGVGGAAGARESQGPQRERVWPDAGDGRPALPDPDGAGRAPQRWSGAVFRKDGAPERRRWWDAEPPVGRVVDGLPGRVDRLRGLGNAVVPQVVEWLGWRLRTAHEEQTHD